MKIKILRVPEELKTMRVNDLMKLIASILPRTIIGYLISTEQVKDSLPIWVTMYTGDLTSNLMKLTELGLKVEGYE